jgi:hypothetical protein
MSAIPTDKSITRKTLNNYKKELKKYLLTSRFTNKTAQENEIYRSKHSNIGCIYCTPEKVSKTMHLESVLFILEMNNDTNTIMGIGMVRNHAYSGLFHVYEEGNYNRFVYTGKYRIARKEFSQKEEEIMKILDKMLFTGTHHMKRGQGLLSFPIETLYACKEKQFDLVNYISMMFKQRIAPKNKVLYE